MGGGSGRLAALAVVAVFVLAACSGGAHRPVAAPKSSRHGGTMRLAVVGVDGDLDPVDVVATDQSQMVVLDLLADGLTSIDLASGQPVPALATKWSTDAPGTTWTFTLADGVMFSNGTAVTAAQVVASLEHVAQHPESLAGAQLDVIAGSAEFAAGSASHMSGLAAPDEQTVRITTISPQADLPALLASPLYGVVEPPEPDPSVTAVTTAVAVSSSPWSIGAGPFRVADRAGSLATATSLVRSDGGSAQLDSIELVRVADTAAGLRAVQQGRADWAPAPPGTSASTAPAGTLHTSPLGAEEFFGMNLASPTFANQLFRQAIVRAVDRTKVVRAGLPALVPSSAIVPTGVAGSTADPCGDPCRFSPDQAKALLAQAFPDGQVPLVEVDTSDGEGDVAAANSVRDQLMVVGIPAQVKAQPFDDYRQFVTTGNQQLFRTGWVGLAPTAGAYLDPMFRSNSLDNLTAFNVTEIDTRLTAAAVEPDVTKRRALYSAIEQTILSLSPVLPLGAYRSSVALAAGVQDYAARLDGTFDVERVWVGAGTPSSTG
jgi:ABC-type transport system substrate-binding protein